MSSASARWLLIAALSLLLVPATSWGARGSVPPLIQQFDEGHGLLIGTLTLAVAAPLPRMESDSSRLRMVFRVDEVIAKPVVDGPWLKDGESFTIYSYAGYGGTFEDWDRNRGENPMGDQPPAGAKFLLSIRWNKNDQRFEHADGSGVAEPLIDLPADRRNLIGQIRDIASLRGHERLKRCRQLAGDVDSLERIRVLAIRHLQDRCFHAHPAGDDAKHAARDDEQKQTTATLYKAWRDPALIISPALVHTVDSALMQADYENFRGSADRRDVWISHLFRPRQAGTRDESMAELRSRPLSILTDIAEKDAAHAAPVGRVLMKQLTDPAWPLEFRYQIASSLAWMDDRSTAPDADWEEAWRQFLATTLPRAEGWESLLLLSAIEWRIGANENTQPKRPLAVSNDLVRLLTDKRDQLILKAAQRDADSQYTLARQQSDRLLAWIEGRKAR